MRVVMLRKPYERRGQVVSFAYEAVCYEQGNADELSDLFGVPVVQAVDGTVTLNGVIDSSEEIGTPLVVSPGDYVTRHADRAYGGLAGTTVRVGERAAFLEDFFVLDRLQMTNDTGVHNAGAKRNRAS